MFNKEKIENAHKLLKVIQEANTPKQKNNSPSTIDGFVSTIFALAVGMQALSLCAESIKDSNA